MEADAEIVHAPPAEGGEFGADLGGAPPAGGELPPAEGETAITPESVKKNMNILLEKLD